jgi:hypothetical protein
MEETETLMPIWPLRTTARPWPPDLEIWGLYLIAAT